MKTELNERKEEVIDNNRLCELLKGYFKTESKWTWSHCYFPRGNDFSMPYKPRYFSICFGCGDGNPILIDYTPDFEPKKAADLMENLDWNFLYQNSKETNGKRVFHGLYRRTDRFDLTLPLEICDTISAYLSPDAQRPVRQTRGRPKTKQ